jgi:acyl-CoA synthetase (AMP-forming)/AMP-acid ligase II
MAISRGGAVILLNDLFHPAILLKSIQEHRVTTIFMIRTMLSQILQYPHLEKYDLGSMKSILLGGMINPARTFYDALEKFPKIHFYNAYGITEASARVSLRGPEHLTHFAGSIGKPIKGCKMEIITDNGTEAGTDQIGEIYVQSDYDMEQYYKNPELTAQTLTPKGLRTKDLGYKDKNGFYYVVGRNDDLIIQGGNKIYPLEIEELLLKHASIKETVVLGIEDETLGQKIIALVSVYPDRPLDAKDLYKWCCSNLDEHKIPKKMHIVEDIPRTIHGKISIAQLKKDYYNGIYQQEVRQ